MRLGERGLLALTCGLLLHATAALAEHGCRWPEWESFRDQFVHEGRVIDPASPRMITTSEGQAYALFFALVADDRAAFDALLRWTQDNLAQGDLTARLPAWQWGRRDDGTWRVIDENSATDADLWLAYVLGEAGRQWKGPRLAALGELLVARIVHEEVAVLPGLGRTLLPAPKGFHPAANRWRLNPSYTPLPLLRRLAALYPKSGISPLVTTSVEVMVRSSPRGFASDWIAFTADKGFEPDGASVGSYDAIRVYLWAGMTSEQDPLQGKLIRTWLPMAQYTAKHGVPPREIDTRDGRVNGVGPAGFSAALLPFLSAARMKDAVRQQNLRLKAMEIERSGNYYDRVLHLFGTGWNQSRFRFAADGRLIVQKACTRNE